MNRPIKTPPRSAERATGPYLPDELGRLADRLPTLPAVVMQVMTLASNPECSVTELGDVIARDPSLSAQVLRAVNAAYYGRRTSISTAQRAVSLMGVRAVRNLVLCVAAKGAFVPPPAFPLEAFWEGALRRAASAQLLARQLGLPNQEELFTLGLLQEVGLLALTVLEPDYVPTLVASLDKPAEERLQIERAHVGHDELSFNLLREWKLEARLLAPLRCHHRLELCAPEDLVRARLLRASDALADLSSSADKLAALCNAEQRLADLGIGRDKLAELLGEIDKLVQASAQLLGIRAGTQPELSAILALAADGLADVNLGYERLVGELEASLERQRSMAAELERLNQKLQQESTTDSLTGLPNRRAFDEALDRELAKASRHEKPLSLLMFDIDHFKCFNDTHGHAAGDAVLKAIGRALASTMRRGDLVARHGGEEFVAILPFTSLDGADIAAERARRKVERTRVEWLGEQLQATVSVGCAEVLDPQDPRAGVKALRAADDALYAAKELGRNRVHAAKP